MYIKTPFSTQLTLEESPDTLMSFTYLMQSFITSTLSFVSSYSECGCGSGDSGCLECGVCKVCAGELDNWGGGGGLFENLPEEVVRIRERIRRGKKEKGDAKGGAGKEAAIAEGLKLLFGGKSMCM